MLTDLYSTGADGHDPAAIGRARINAARRLLDYQLRASYYSGEWEFTPREWLGFLRRLVILAAKLAIKRVFPFIEHGNDRWHHRSVLAAASQPAAQEARSPVTPSC
jgi:hypothetical protein